MAPVIMHKSAIAAKKEVAAMTVQQLADLEEKYDAMLAQA